MFKNKSEIAHPKFEILENLSPFTFQLSPQKSNFAISEKRTRFWII